MYNTKIEGEIEANSTQQLHFLKCFFQLMRYVDAASSREAECHYPSSIFKASGRRGGARPIGASCCIHYSYERGGQRSKGKCSYPTYQPQASTLEIDIEMIRLLCRTCSACSILDMIRICSAWWGAQRGGCFRAK